MADEKSVFVSDMSSATTEAMLLSVFGVCGPIKSVRICRDTSGRSLGSGFVNFCDPLAASYAILRINFTEIDGKQIRVMRSHADPMARNGNDGSNVFIKNLDKSVDNKCLHEVFKRFGRILSSKVAQEVNGLSKGFGFVQFEAQESAVDAIEALNGRQLYGKTVFCNHFINKSERKKFLFNKNSIKSFANVFVKNLSEDFNRKTLLKYFCPFGKIMAAEVIHKSRSFGFIAFEDTAMAERAVRIMNGLRLDNGNIVHVSRAVKVVHKNPLYKPLTQRGCEGNHVLIKYLNPSLDSHKLNDLFSSFGTISFAQSVSGFGFVCFRSQESAQKAVRVMNNAFIGSRPLFVSMVGTVCDDSRPSMTQAMEETANSRQLSTL